MIVGANQIRRISGDWLVEQRLTRFAQAFRIGFPTFDQTGHDRVSQAACKSTSRPRKNDGDMSGRLDLNHHGFAVFASRDRTQ